MKSEHWITISSSKLNNLDDINNYKSHMYLLLNMREDHMEFVNNGVI